MIRMDAKDADLALADAHWWLKGFLAATPTGTSGHLDVLDAHARVGRVRHWLQSLLCGDWITIHTTDSPFHRQGLRVVITEAQLERLTDGLRTTASPEDQADGREACDELWARAKGERASILNPDAPF